jgi:hypothetical protein
MRLVDVGMDAARILRVVGPGQVRAVFTKALYLQVPGGLVVLVTMQAPRGPLHLRVTNLPAVAPGCPVQVSSDSLRIAHHCYVLDGPTWTPMLPSAVSMKRARQAVRSWLPDLCPPLDLGHTARAALPGDAVSDLHRGHLRSFAATIAGRGPGLTPAGDDVLAGVLLATRAMCSASAAERLILRQCARCARTNDIARAFLACAAEGRCIEPAHDLLIGLANADGRAVISAVEDLSRYGSSSGTALTYGIRIALLEGRGPVKGELSAHDQEATAYSG